MTISLIMSKRDTLEPNIFRSGQYQCKNSPTTNKLNSPLE